MSFSSRTGGASRRPSRPSRGQTRWSRTREGPRSMSLARSETYRANRHLDRDKDGIACEKA